MLQFNLAEYRLILANSGNSLYSARFRWIIIVLIKIIHHYTTTVAFDYCTANGKGRHAMYDAFLWFISTRLKNKTPKNLFITRLKHLNLCFSSSIPRGILTQSTTEMRGLLLNYKITTVNVNTYMITINSLFTSFFETTYHLGYI